MIRLHNQTAARMTYAVPPVVQRPEWITTRQKCPLIWEISSAPVGTADEEKEALDAALQETADETAEAQPEESGLRAYGCAYHGTAQRLTVSWPGERVRVRFGSHSCLKRMGHAEDGAGLVVQEAGDYEITFELCAAVKAASPITFELAAGEEKVPGGTVTAILPGGIRQYCCSVMAPLRAGDCVGVVMTSASVCGAEFTANGARLMIKKLD